MKNKIERPLRAAAVGALVLLAACTTPPAEPPVATIKLIHSPSNVDELLAYGIQVRKMSAAEVARELQRANANPSGPANAVRRAMLLAATRDPIDLARAEAQLWNVMADNSVEADKLKPFVQLLVGHYSDLRRVADNAEKSAGQARDAQRKVDLLNEKLEALKNIERSLPAAGK
ncbi:hypothetical protein [Herbaspirillum sp. YR522]|uniref:hypothetical protein n=1 Tax=Herbaspirillum sp. YR522 TaxID=1144342 RepID=UPI00026F4A53|nr:hypothetical protein [Herbaspirillum sp. YR522]EJN09404.1 hypothetical protein PMI40_00673 [Herbaspirillum sp. YR522]